VFENKVLRRIFGPTRKRDENGAGERRLHNEEINNLNASPSIIRAVK
jgi:hypothetical protein